ncbi:serine protease [Xanthobacter sp. 126]|uniref:S1 family peptidase n=1 Tax=Xanthobacter sp. 126 TaxID=1131814 RepID=UPI0009DDBD24|nr:serine protease [Xanthobacter sp. 126]
MQTFNKSAIHPLSWTTTRIRVFRNHIELGSGSGFYVNFAKQYYLVTNWHVLSGRHAVTEACLERSGAIPNRIEFHVPVSERFGEAVGVVERISLRSAEVDLQDSSDAPVWIDSRDTGPFDDFAIIPVERIQSIKLGDGENITSISAGNVMHVIDGDPPEPRALFTNFNPTIGSDVFVLGYPHGLELTGILPIWKRASIVTEPLCPVRVNGVDIDNLFYVDGSTRRGMSGSPVLYIPRQNEVIRTDDGHVINYTSRDPILVGVYAGRDGVTNDEYELSLGRVWKTLGIQNLIMRYLSRSSSEYSPLE